LNPFIWHDEGRQRTNPAFVLKAIAEDLEERFRRNWKLASLHVAQAVEDLMSAGIAVPPSALASVRPYLPAGFNPSSVSDHPRVLGLVVSIGSNDGFVLPLRCQLDGSRWDESLPFRREDVLDALAQLVGSAGLPTAGVLPERLQFTFANPLGHEGGGNSITVAAALSVLDALDKHRSDLLRCACAVVEPAEGGRFRSVRHVKPKLAAAIREHGGASLLVCAPGCREVDDVRSRFDVIWEVRSFEDLAAKLHEAGILQPLFQKVPLRWDELERVGEELRVLVQTRHQYHQATGLGGRLLGCATTGPVPVSLWTSIRGLVAQAHRHQGNFQEAYQGWKDVQEGVDARANLTSYDERAETAAEFASTLFDCHRFAEIPPLLEQWVVTIRNDPQKLKPQTRVHLLNTLGRALIVLGKQGWDEHFLHSLEIQERLDRGNLLRTTCYRIYGMLHEGLYDAARNTLHELGPLGDVPGFSGQQLRFLRADLARRTAEMWEDPELEEIRPGQACPGHPVAWYLQARGRQFCAPAMDGQVNLEQARTYLHRAADFLRHDAQNQPRNICGVFASCFDLFAASLVDSATEWTRSRDEIRRFVDDPAAEPLREYYAVAISKIGILPSRAVAEEFLSLVPYL
jgi:hypothetical protein